MSAPSLLAGRRRRMAVGLAALALCQAVAAVLFAEALDALLLAQPWPGLQMVSLIGGLALLASLILLAERWVGEVFAQTFVVDCRAALFAAVTHNAGQGRDARWLTGLVNDMAALRNYALRGSVRLWTSTLSAAAAAFWMILSAPSQRLAILPLAVGAVAIMALVRPLTRAIARQRAQRGRLNRFLVRRVRAEMAGTPSPRGHGFKKQAALSDTLQHFAVQRAAVAGTMDATAVLAGSLAAFVLVLRVIESGEGMGIAGNLTLIAFISARLLEASRALHASVGGKIAMTRLIRLTAAKDSRSDRRRSRPSPEL